MDEKIIQITVTPESEYQYEELYALTDKGRIFLSIDGEAWSEVKLPKELEK